MATKNITGPEFKDTIHGEGITFVDFWASWCGPCMRFGPIYEKASEANPDITFAKVDTQAEQELAGALGISSIPTLMVSRRIFLNGALCAPLDPHAHGLPLLLHEGRGVLARSCPHCTRARPPPSTPNPLPVDPGLRAVHSLQSQARPGDATHPPLSQHAPPRASCWRSPRSAAST